MTVPTAASAPPSDTASPLAPQDVGHGPPFWAMCDAVVVGNVTTGRIVLLNLAAERSMIPWWRACLVEVPRGALLRQSGTFQVPELRGERCVEGGDLAVDLPRPLQILRARSCPLGVGGMALPWT